MKRTTRNMYPTLTILTLMLEMKYWMHRYFSLLGASINNLPKKFRVIFRRVSNIFGDFVLIIHETVIQCALKFTTCFIKWRGSTRNTYREQKPWFDDNCKKKKANFHKARKVYNLFKNDINRDVCQSVVLDKTINKFFALIRVPICRSLGFWGSISLVTFTDYFPGTL
jgi:hypothetical protein